jgi:hypothetical protein
MQGSPLVRVTRLKGSLRNVNYMHEAPSYSRMGALTEVHPGKIWLGSASIKFADSQALEGNIGINIEVWDSRFAGLKIDENASGVKLRPNLIIFCSVPLRCHFLHMMFVQSWSRGF